jgi:thiamine-monophosphate kinase
MPRVAAGLALAGVAHAAIDVSDGLLADLGHVCTASGVGAEIELEALPASPTLLATFDAQARHGLQACGGDDYELCFTAAAAQRDAIAGLARECAVAMTRIGCIVEGSGVLARDGTGRRWQPTAAGYVHFES